MKLNPPSTTLDSACSSRCQSETHILLKIKKKDNLTQFAQLRQPFQLMLQMPPQTLQALSPQMNDSVPLCPLSGNSLAGLSSGEGKGACPPAWGAVGG